jgi:hypothetical protein
MGGGGGLYLVKPMLDANKSGDKEWMIKYKDIAPLDTTISKNQCVSELDPMTKKRFVD